MPMDAFQEFIATSRYARWKDKEGRRENWSETSLRYLDFMDEMLASRGYVLIDNLYEHCYHYLNSLKSLPSMRAIMTAGAALDRSNIAGYNCCYLPIDSMESFHEVLFILLNGTGVGFSVERQYIDQLPPLAPARTGTHPVTVVFEDSKEGWALGYKAVLTALWDGYEVEWDLSKIRPAGSPLKTFGGRASGPEPLRDLLVFTRNMFYIGTPSAAFTTVQRRLTPLEVMDLVCKIASVVVVGGVRRSALICLSDLDDYDIATSKSGNWWDRNPQRALANISAVYNERPSYEEFDREWRILQASGSGERGIVNRYAMQKKAKEIGRDHTFSFGVNPCAEIALRPYQFCNLSTVVVEPEDTLQDLRDKVVTSAIFGTWQSALTDFPILRDKWRVNTEEERLLGVSLTGVYGHPVLNGSQGGEVLAEWLEMLNQTAHAVNQKMANNIGINPSKAITTIKPEGTVSQLTNTSSGIHPWYAPHYIRTVRMDNKNPLTHLMKDSDVPNEPDVMSPENNTVFSFPRKAPDGAVCTLDVSALDHLYLILKYQEFWADHNISATISIRPEEWDEVRDFVWNHFDDLRGLSFLPYEENTYQQAPFQSVSYSEYLKMDINFPHVRWEDLSFYEREDQTEGAQTLACVSKEGCDSLSSPSLVAA